MRFGFVSLVAIAALGLPLVLTGCGSGSGSRSDIGQVCTASVDPALIVYVTDAVTGAPAVNGATAVVTDGKYTETLKESVFQASTTDPSTTVPVAFSGAAERAGTYTITITRRGYVTAVQSGVTVTQGECHVNTRTLDIALTPQDTRATAK